MKKVLFISYYWPPSGGSGVQRSLKFVKYLPEFGWQPVVYTPENGEMPELDTSLLKEVPLDVEVIKRPIIEPYSLYKFFAGKTQNDKINPNFFTQKNDTWKDRFAIWIRSNFFIPDARMLWIRPSVNFLVKYLKDHQVDAIVSTGPPHSMHLIALGVKLRTGLPWLADFRDPWTNIDFYKELSLTPWADRKHRKLERRVLDSADEVVMAGYTWADELGLIGNRHVKPLLNGYDPSDFQFDVSATLDKEFTIVHLGMFSKGRNHEILWKALRVLCDEDIDFAKDLSFRLYGKYDVSAIEYMKKYNLEKSTIFNSYVPHSEIVKVQASSQVLYLSVNNTPNVKGIMTGKIFEYMAVKRPILCIGPEDGDAARIVLESKAGFVSGFNDLD
ncbi:MAG: glycosyl transferase, partial [Cytophagales bacterium]|nr:glycosyl transferase [Cytophagales bacterium]